jgi:uncharacterized cupin superfamily protein
MVPWDPVPPEILESGEGTESGHEYYSGGDGKVTAGVWDATPQKLVPGPYNVNEFMIVLEGAITIEQTHGETETFRAGEGFVIPKGLPCSFQVPEYARKFYLIFDDDSGLEPENPSSLSPIRVDSSADLPGVSHQDPNQYISDVPEMSWLTLYKDITGQFEAGVWDCTPMQRVPATLARSELMHILEGSGSITNGDGIVFEFQAGDTFLAPFGMGYQWRNDEYVKKIFCSFTPN